MSEKELLFSVTSKDCEWSYTRGTGNGGQKKQKTSSAVHCIHKESGAHGYSEETRSQHENKKLAFLKMAKTKEFQKWHKIETSRRLGQLLDIDKIVEEQMKQVKIEMKKDGKWIEWDESLIEE
jgi:protein subunit release factor B